MTKPIDELMQREMTRKEFLSVIGFGIASLVGLSAILELLGKTKSEPQQHSNGYGSNAYGR